MTFLQPVLLFALPLVALPILIHLINRQRHRTIAWGAMMFLLDAKRMTRGMARLRHWLVMAMRMLAIAALLLAIARPLVSGRVGIALGGVPDTTIIILDRSASMQQQDMQSGESKRTAALGKLSQLLRTVGQAGHRVLIDSGENKALPLDSTETLLESPSTTATDAAANIPAMLQTALEYIKTNQTGRTDVWICSDMRASDWRREDGRWTQLRQEYGPLDGVRFHILGYPEPAPRNLTIWVDHPRVAVADDATQLVLDVAVRRSAGSTDRLEVPLEFVINGARSVATLEMNDIESRLQGHSIPLDGKTRSGWGYVELPADANLHDNRFYFVFGDTPERHTVIISSDLGSSELLRLATTAPVDPTLPYTADVVSAMQLDEIDWDKASMILWQAPLPTGDHARQLESFVESGRPVLFFPPSQPDDSSWAGFRWGHWEVAPTNQALQVESWRGDSDLLAHAGSGTALPVGDLQVYQYCTLDGTGQVLATMRPEVPLLVRGNLGAGAFYFFTTLPGAKESSLRARGLSFTSCCIERSPPAPPRAVACTSGRPAATRLCRFHSGNSSPHHLPTRYQPTALCSPERFRRTINWQHSIAPRPKTARKRSTNSSWASCCRDCHIDTCRNRLEVRPAWPAKSGGY